MAEAADIQFPINQALLEETATLKQDRMLMAERMAKIEATREQVSPAVYERVAGEYQSKFDQLTQALMEKKAEIDRELGTLYDTRQKVMANLDSHKTALEELEFRKQLGEFDDAEFQNRAKEAKDKLSKFEKIIEAVNGNIHKYEDLFADFGARPVIQETPAPVMPGAATKSAAQSATKYIPVKKKTAAAEYELPAEHFSGYFESSPDDVHERPTSVATPPPAPRTQKTQVFTKATSPSIKPGTAYLVVARGAADSPKYPLGKETTIGRAHTNHIVLKEARISRQHATIRQAGKEFVIEDLQSSNGIIVNNEKVKEHVLSNGDQIQIGDFLLEFHQ